MPRLETEQPDMTATFSTIVMSVGSKRGLPTLAFCASISNHKCLMAMAQWQSVGLRPSELTNAFRATRRSQRHDQGDGDSDLSRLRETATADLAHSPARNISYTTVAGFPRTRQLGGTSFKTTEPAETTAPSPIVTPGRIRLPIAIQLPVQMRMGATLSLKSSRRISWLPVQRNDRRATQTLDSIVTCARLRIPTSSPIQTWSPTTRRHGNEIFTLLPMPTPFPIFAPK